MKTYRLKAPVERVSWDDPVDGTTAKAVANGDAVLVRASSGAVAIVSGAAFFALFEEEPEQRAATGEGFEPFTPTPGQRTRLGIDDPPAPPREVPGDDPDRYAAQLQQIPMPSPQVCRVVVPDAGEYAVCGSLLEAGGSCPVHGGQA